MSEIVPEFKIDLDFSEIIELQKQLGDLGKKPTYNAFYRTVKRILEGASLQAIRIYADQYKGQIAKLKAAQIIRGVINGGDGTNITSLNAGIVFKARQPSLTALSGSQNKRGVKWGRGQFVQSGFKAVTGFQTTRDGDIGSDSYSFFKRTGKFSAPKRGVWQGRRYVRGARKGQLILREQIKKLVGYSPSYVFTNATNAKTEIESYIAERFDREMSSNFDYYVDRALAKHSKGL